MFDGFLWGAATSAHQIEGGRALRGESVWDRFAHSHGKTAEGHHADVACDHFHRWEEDLDLLAAMGANSYRFSLSWPRIVPEFGQPSEAGIEFYRRLLKGLSERGIRPLVNLYHWDLPVWAQDRGGWLSPEVVEWFRAYADLAGAELGEWASDWMTCNEPNCFIGDGIMGSVHAPGLARPWEDGMTALRQFFLAHREASQALRARVPGAKTTVALTGPIWCPTDESEEAIAAARARTFAMGAKNLWTHGLFLDALTGRNLEADALETIGFEPEAGESVDFVTLNLYSGGYVDGANQVVKLPPGAAASHFHWPVTPEIAYWGPKFFQERSGLPVLIGENGLSLNDWVTLDGVVPDALRVDFMRRHLLALRRWVQEGGGALGYHHWSLLDNFEWQEGYRQRFGLIHVDFDSLKRTPKQSYHWYQRVISTCGASLDEPIP